MSQMNSKEAFHNTALLNLTTLHSRSVPLRNNCLIFTPLSCSQWLEKCVSPRSCWTTSSPPSQFSRYSNSISSVSSSSHIQGCNQFHLNFFQICILRLDLMIRTKWFNEVWILQKGHIPTSTTARFSFWHNLNRKTVLIKLSIKVVQITPFQKIELIIFFLFSNIFH